MEWPQKKAISFSEARAKAQFCETSWFCQVSRYLGRTYKIDAQCSVGATLSGSPERLLAEHNRGDVEIAV
jgi:hypothetical protein